MAAMATPQQAMRAPVIEVRGPNHRLAWAVWIIVTVVGAVVGALAAWQVRRLGLGSSTSLEAVRYIATILDAAVAAGAQWFVLRRYRVEAYWWIPATVSARLIVVIIVIPSVIRPFVPSVVNGPLTLTTAIISSASALAAAGLVVGVAQAIVLRSSGGNIAWAWVPATIVGGALAGAVTSAISVQLFSLPFVVILSVVTATGALLTAASQAPVLLRLLR